MNAKMDLENEIREAITEEFKKEHERNAKNFLVALIMGFISAYIIWFFITKMHSFVGGIILTLIIIFAIIDIAGLRWLLDNWF